MLEVLEVKYLALKIASVLKGLRNGVSMLLLKIKCPEFSYYDYFRQNLKLIVKVNFVWE